MSLAKTILITSVCAYLVVLAIMYTMQRRLMYIPSKSDVTPIQLGIQNAEALSLDTSDGEKISVWYTPPQSPDDKTILFFHGNAGSIVDRANRFATFQSAGLGVLFVSYRGYGPSSGTPTEAGLKLDAEAAYKFLINKKTPVENIVAVGESLGTGLAVYIAATQEVGMVILEAPYTSTVDVAADIYWWLPVRSLLKDRFESIKMIKDITVPVYIFHGTRDNVIPDKFGKMLFEAANEPKTYIPVEGAGHEALFDPEIWQKEIELIRNPVTLIQKGDH